MNRDLVFSIVAHAVIILGILFLSPLEFRKPKPFGEVIRVSAVSMSELTPSEAEMTEPPQIPRAMEAEEPDIPVSKPVSEPEAKVEKKKTPTPKKKQDKPTPPKPADNTLKNPDAVKGDVTQSGTKEGSTEVKAPAGGPFTGATVDNAAFNYPFWFNLAWGKIRQNFRVPVSIDGKVYCDVYFQVIKSGKVVESKVVNSSGIIPFDDACLAAINRSSPFPPLPDDFVSEIIGITITFTNE